MKRPGAKHVVFFLTIIAVTVALLAPGLAVGATRDADVPCDTDALINAIEAANSSGGADTLNLAAGCVYSLNAVTDASDGANGLPSISGVLVINGNGATIERSHAAGAPNFRIFHVALTGSLTLNELTVSHGWPLNEMPGRFEGGGVFNRGTLILHDSTVKDNQATSGGGIYNEGGVVALNAGSLVRDNFALYGGGIYNHGGTLELNASHVNANTVGDGNGGGGGIYNASGTVTLSNSSVNSNLVGDGANGGGMLNHAGIVTLSDSEVRFNWSYTYYNTLRGLGRGGGIYNDTGTLTLANSVVSNNPASGSGGGIHNGAGRLTLINNLIRDNSVSSYPGGSGGGIYNGGTLTLVNNTISENTARGGGSPPRPGRGGGVYNSGTMTLTNNTISQNAAKNYNYGSYGGGICDNNGTATLVNNVVSDNSVDYYYDEDNDVLYGGGANCEGAIISGGHNLDSGNTCGFAGPGDLSDTDPVLGPLQDNGGPTETYALLRGSPAIDAGSNAACPATDQRGEPRPADGDGDGAAICDIGAYELPPPFITEVPCDIGALIEAIDVANNNGEADILNLAAGCTYTLTVVNNDVNGPNGLPSINSEMTVNGNETTITRDSDDVFRILHVAAGGDLVLNRLTVSHGQACAGICMQIANGGGIYNAGTLELADSTVTRNYAMVGGGIFNTSTLTLNNSVISHNWAYSTPVGISNDGELTLNNSTVSNNASVMYWGDGIGNNGTLTLNSSTVSGNSGRGIANSGAATVSNSTVSDNDGHGIENDGTLTLNSSTISGNGGLAGIVNQSTVELTNSIVASQISGVDCEGNPVTSRGYNLDSDGTCNLSAALNDIPNTDPRLGPLEDYGGPTLTRALYSDSPAIDQGSCSDLDFDQRGAPRRIDIAHFDNADDACDIGAFERQEDTTAVEMLSFTAQPSANHVTLAWQTGTEVDNAGFNLWRAEAADGTYTQLNTALIPAQGDPVSGASYSYTDHNMVQGMTYYYKLEDVDTHGVSALHGPVSATPSAIRRVYLPLVLK
jgi:hypothetical protein